jgi:hypothetical protein
VLSDSAPVEIGGLYARRQTGCRYHPFARGLLAFWLVWLGFTQGDQALVLVVWIMILDWMGDSIDGPIARRSSVYYHTWIGDHDLEVDITVSTGLLIYRLSSGFLQWQWVVIYLLDPASLRQINVIIG